MGLEKAIEHGKEKRKPYKGSKAVSYGCRHGGNCDYCRLVRTRNGRKRLNEAKMREKEARE